MVPLSARMAKSHWLFSILRKRTVAMELNSLNLHRPLESHQRGRNGFILPPSMQATKCCLIEVCSYLQQESIIIHSISHFASHLLCTCSIQDCCQSKTLWHRRWQRAHSQCLLAASVCSQHERWWNQKLTSLLKLLAWRHRGQDIDTDYRILSPVFG